MRTVTLVSLGLGGATVATGTALAINNYIVGQSIKEHIEKSKKSKNKVFITTQGLDLGDIKTKYETYNDETKRPKPKNKEGKAISKDDLVEWCNNNSNNTFGTEDSTYKSILSWCFLNPKTIAQEMESRGKKLLSTHEATHDDWKNAWERYNANKVTLNLKIPEKTETDLNKANSNKEKGGPELQKWCTGRKEESKKLYEEDIEETYEIFEAWCTANAG